MAATYAYSLNGENYAGQFHSREAALAAATQKASGAADPPAAVYVGEMVGGEAHAARLGAAVVDELRRRVREQQGDGGTYLKRLKPAALSELDRALEHAVLGWLRANDLMPTDVKVTAISEHPIPLPHRGLSNLRPGGGGIHGANGEVHDLGIGDYTGEPR